MSASADVHPLAAMFPMLPDDELLELADDIATNGLMHPIMLDRNGRLIDGRNRLKACGLAQMEPRFETFAGDEGEVVAYIISTNVNRRHLSKGQRAMAVAMAYPEPEKGGRGKNSKLNLEFSGMTLSQARTVFRDDPEVAKSVMAGAVSLPSAYEATKQKSASEEQRREAMEQLRSRFPDLAASVEAGELSYKAALVEQADRDERARQERLTRFQAVRQACEALAIVAFEDDFAELARAHPDDFRAANPLGMKYLAERAGHSAQGAARLAEILKQLDMEHST